MTNNVVLVPALLTEESVYLLLPDGCVARLTSPEVEVASPDDLIDALLEIAGEETAAEVQAYVDAHAGGE